MSDLTPHQQREVNQAIRHIGRAMKALDRAKIPDPVDFVTQTWFLHNGFQMLAKASDKLIAAMEPVQSVRGDE